MADVQVSVGSILGEAAGLAKRHFGLLTATGLAIAGGYTALDLLGAASASFVVSLIVTVLVQYLVFEQLLADRMLFEAKGNRRYWSLFASGVLSGLAIGVGVLLLVLPGLYLAGRWLSASAFVVAEGRGATEALQASWDASAPSQAAHVTAALISALPIALLIGQLLMVMYGGQDIDGLTVTIFINVVTALSSLLVWVLGAAAYRVTAQGHGELEGVFA